MGKLNKISKYSSKREAKDIISKILEIALLILLITYCISLLILPLFMLLTSFKADSLECVHNPFGLPGMNFKYPEYSTIDFHFENYPLILEIMNEKMSVSIPAMLGNGFIMAVAPGALSLFFTALFAYVEAKYDFIGRKFLFNLGIVLMIIPIVGNLASAMQIRKFLLVYNNMFMHIITSPVGCFYGMNFLLLYAAFKGMPWDYAESVFIDGGNHYTVLFRIYFPMIMPTLLSLFLLSFMGAWNDYTTYLVWLPDYPNIAYGMYRFTQDADKYLVDLPVLMAGFTLVMIPTIVLYFFTHNTIQSRMMVGGLKG